VRTYRIAAIPRDGIGKEVVAAGLEVLLACAERDGRFTLDIMRFEWGSERYKEMGVHRARRWTRICWNAAAVEWLTVCAAMTGWSASGWSATLPRCKRRCLHLTTPVRVRLEGACHLWRKIPSRRLSIYLEADERFGWVTVRTAGQAVNIGAGSETIWGNVLSTGGESPNMRCVEDRQTKITKIPPMDEVWEGTGANSQSYRQRLVRNVRQALSHLI
jgi:hypothetical protein